MEVRVSTVGSCDGMCAQSQSAQGEARGIAAYGRCSDRVRTVAESDGAARAPTIVRGDGRRESNSLVE